MSRYGMVLRFPVRESNKGNPAARAYIGTSAAAERGMVTWIMRLNMRGTGGFPMSRASIYSTDLR